MEDKSEEYQQVEDATRRKAIHTVPRYAPRNIMSHT